MFAASLREVVRRLCCLIDFLLPELAHLRTRCAEMNELRSKNVDNEPCQIGLVSWLVNVPSPAISDSAAIDSFANAQTTFMNTDGDFAISSEYFKKVDL